MADMHPCCICNTHESLFSICRYVAYRVPRTNSGQSKRPRRVMVFNKKRDHEEYDNKYASYLDTAHTLLLDLPGDLWKGGHDESKAVARMVAGALAPYRKAGLPKPALNRCFSLHRCDTCAQAVPAPSECCYPK